MKDFIQPQHTAELNNHSPRMNLEKNKIKLGHPLAGASQFSPQDSGQDALLCAMSKSNTRDLLLITLHHPDLLAAVWWSRSADT
ncbi:hypothetical protein INR49_010821 [Caranx melampygus]|nr:hypothetical protein INR49_010821 [Caranx melampygus]